MATLDESLIKNLPADLQPVIYENIVRKDYTQAELAEIQSELKDELSKHTEQGRRTDLEDDTSGKNIPKVGRVTDVIGDLFDESRKNVEKRISVHEAAKENPDEYGDLEEAMESNLHSAHNELKRRKEIKEREEKLEDAPEIKNLILGDCLEKIEEVPANSVDAVVTDPPYGIDAITGSRSETVSLRRKWDYEGDTEAIFPLLAELFEKLKPKLKEDAHIYIFTSWKAWHRLFPLVNDFFEVRSWIGYLHYQTTGKKTYGYRGGLSSIMFALNGRGRRISGPGWNFFDVTGTLASNKRNYHPAQKSVSICKKLIENSTVEGETVLDPFAGSGTTLLAAEKLDRNWVGIELDDRWYKTAESRILEVREEEKNGI